MTIKPLSGQQVMPSPLGTLPVPMPAQQQPQPLQTTPQSLLAQNRYESFTGKVAVSNAQSLPVSQMSAGDVGGFQSQLRTVQALGPGGSGRLSHSESQGVELPLHPDPVFVERLQTLPKNRKLAYLRNLKKTQPEQYQRIVNHIRADSIKDPEVAMPMAIHMLSETAYAKGKGKSSIQLLEKMYAQGRVSFGHVTNDQEAITRPDNFANAENGVGTPSQITLNSRMLASPEGTASILAHEALHATNYSKGALQSDLQEEVNGQMAGAQVWSEFPKEKFSTRTDGARRVLLSLDENQKYFDPTQPNDNTAMMSETAATYAYGHATQGNTNRAVETMNQLFVSGYNPATNGTDEQALRLLGAMNLVLKQKPSLRRSPAFMQQMRAVFQRVSAS